jgi:hypothetical protein
VAVLEVEGRPVVGGVAGREAVRDEAVIERTVLLLAVVVRAGAAFEQVEAVLQRLPLPLSNESVVDASNQQFAPALVPLSTAPRS